MQLNALQYRRMHFQEFCAAALCVHQLDVLNSWEDRTHRAYEIFEQKGNKVIAIQELASVSSEFLMYLMMHFHFYH